MGTVAGEIRQADNAESTEFLHHIGVVAGSVVGGCLGRQHLPDQPGDFIARATPLRRIGRQVFANCVQLGDVESRHEKEGAGQWPAPGTTLMRLVTVKKGNRQKDRRLHHHRLRPRSRPSW